MTTANRTFEQSISSLARGTTVILVGTICSQVLGLAANIVLRRNLSVHEFGLIALALSVVFFVQPIAELGFSGGVPRFIGFHRGRNEPGAIRGVIYSALILTTVVGCLFSLGIILASNVIARYMGDPELAPTLQVMAFIAAILAIITVLLGVFRGYARTQQKLLFDDLFPNIVKITILLVIIWVGGSYLWMAGAYLISVVAEALLLLWYANRTVLEPIAASPIDWEAGKKMVRFSLPLMGSNHLNVIGRQSNLMLLGFFLAPSDAALYSTASLIAPAVTVFYTAVRFIFLPVGARLLGENKTDDFNTLYGTLTKWITTLTMPIAAILVIMPGPLIAFAFGEQYRPAAIITQCLVLGWFFSIWTGPNSGALMALGHSGKVFWGLTIANVSSVLLSFVLIPWFGMLGAGIAGMSSLVIGNTYSTVALYRTSRTTPFSRGLVISTLVVGIIVASILPFSGYLEVYPPWVLAPILGIAFYAVSLGSTLLLGGVSAEDRQMWHMVREAIRAKTGR